MSTKKFVRAHARLRRSQVIGTFGPGALVDFPTQSVIIGGLESWGDPVKDGFDPITEDRLLAKVQRALKREDLALFGPPVEPAFGEADTRGLRAFVFPEWFVVQFDESWGDNVRSRRLVHRRQLERGRYVGADKKRQAVVPIRFVQACVNGHISDVDWYGFAHEYRSPCKRQLWLDERGTSGDLADIFVRCECGNANRSLAYALPQGEGGGMPLGFCSGSRPWLGVNAWEACKSPEGKGRPNRLLVRSASNAYFPQVLSVISIPEGDVAVRAAVDAVWSDYLMYVESIEDLAKERKKAKVHAALEGHANEVVWADIERRKTGVPPPDKSIKEAEMETLLGQGPTLGTDSAGSVFSATALPPPQSPSAIMKMIERVVLVHRLREVTAQIGFTRFESAMPDIDGELSLDVTRAALAREAAWVPAVENRGEGFLIAFKDSALDAWVKHPKVQARVDALRSGFDAWAKEHGDNKMEFPGPRYILLHSLSHLLISAVSLACGYAASSIRERIYVTKAGCGILLYTGTSDSEGTLGGLVQVGLKIEEHLRAAIEAGALCSNDPVCAQHRPDHPHERRFLHGAACHGCLLIAEPSCERRNELLDRALVVETVDSLGAELFRAGSPDGAPPVAPGPPELAGEPAP